MLSASGTAAADTQTAETLFRSGLDAMKREDFKGACDAFAGSNEADPSPGTQINLALCNEKQGKLASAWGWYRTAAGLADMRGLKDRADRARGEEAKLEPKLHKLLIRVKPPIPDGLMIMRNGVSLPSAVVGKELPVDPGEQSIEVRATGKKPWKTKLNASATPGVEAVDVPTLEDAPPEAAGGAAGGADYRPPSGGGSDGSTQRTIGFVLGGAGILALVTAGGIQIFNFAVTNRDYKDVAETFDKECGTVPTRTAQECTDLQASRDSKDDARDGNQVASIVVGAAGVALLTTGIVLALTAPSGSRSAKSSTPLFMPLVGRDNVGFGVRGVF